MGEPFTFVGAAAASVGTITKVISQVFAYSEVPDDVRAFQNSIEAFNGTLATARRLRRVKSHLLDPREKQDIDKNIHRATVVLDDISVTIEACRNDLDVKKTVGCRNRVLWLLRDHHTFMSRTHTLNICHQNLNSDIGAMRQLQSAIQPPSYDDINIISTLKPPSRRCVGSISKTDPNHCYHAEVAPSLGRDCSPQQLYELESEVSPRSPKLQDSSLLFEAIDDSMSVLSTCETITNTVSAPGRIEQSGYGGSNDYELRESDYSPRPRRTRRSFMIT